jgi:hypothetical protein
MIYVVISFEAGFTDPDGDKLFLEELFLQLLMLSG